MFAPKHVLVPVDADVSGDKALADGLVDDAADLASAFDARITLVHVALPVSSPAVPPEAEGPAYRAMLHVLDVRNQAAKRALEALAKRVIARGLTCDSALVTDPGNVPELLLSTAERIGADLVVIATHGRRGMKRVVLGGVAERVAHLAKVPVLLLPPKH